VSYSVIDSTVELTFVVCMQLVCTLIGVVLKVVYCFCGIFQSVIFYFLASTKFFTFFFFFLFKLGFVRPYIICKCTLNIY
jgi:hypothetical protein